MMARRSLATGIAQGNSTTLQLIVVDPRSQGAEQPLTLHDMLGIAQVPLGIGTGCRAHLIERQSAHFQHAQVHPGEVAVK